MKSSIRLGRFRGIDIGLHWSVAVIALLAGSTVAGTVLPAFAPGYAQPFYLLAATGVIAAFLASIIAHELGHSVVAQRNEVGVSHITLFALGGVAALESEPPSPGAAARIALAGPAVSLAIGAVTLGVAFLALPAIGLGALSTAAVTWVGIVNLSLAVFNMIPALPLDGGRVLQAALWKRKGEPHSATITAARFGRLAGWALVLFGIWEVFTTGDGIFTILIGWFVASSAKSEARRARSMLGRTRWQQLFVRRPSNCNEPIGVWNTSRIFPPPPPSGHSATRRGPVIDVSGRPLQTDTVPR